MKIHSAKYMVLLLIVLPLGTQAQRNLPWDLWQNPATRDFATIQQNVEAWYSGKDKGKGTGYKHWKRWEEFNRDRLDANGRIVNVAALNLQAFKDQKPDSDHNQRNVEGDWKAWSATEYVAAGSWAPGIGRVQTVAFHPTNPSILYVGAPAGGLFKTVNHGADWINISDTLSSIGVSGIAVDPVNTNTIFILTGDGDGGNTRSIGVYKTTNDGQSWSPTGLTWMDTSNVLGRRMLMEPGYPSWMLVAASNGLWQSTNSGVNWSLVQAGNFYDIEYKPGNTSVVYASTGTQVYKSTNYGQTWTLAQSFDASRIEMAVTPDDPDAVYLLTGPSDTTFTMNPTDTIPGFKGVYRSWNSGTSFTKYATTPNILSGNFAGDNYKDQTGWDLALVVSPAQDSILLTGGVNTWKSINAGQSFAINTYWIPGDAQNNGLGYVHADIHYMIYNPLNNWLYSANDGGIFYTTDDGTTWTDITGGLNISQLYHFAGTDQDVNFMVGGMQDNGTGIFTENDTLKSILGADGGDVLIHPQNKNIIYAMTQLGNLLKSTNGGQSFSGISPFQHDDNNPGPFITSWDMDMNNPDTIYVGWTNDTIYRTFNGGTSWTKVKMPGGFNQEVQSVSVASNSSRVYALTCQVAWRSSNYGTTWTQFDTIYAPGGCYTSISANPSNPNKAILTRGGFGPGFNRVLEYTSTTNITIPILGIGGSTGVLPEVPVSIAARHASNPEVYVGTDIGVYFYSYNNPFAGWTKFKRGFPNTIVRDIEIYEAEGIMRVGTFGRGIWQSDVWDDCSYELTLTQGNDPDNGMPGFQFNEAADIITSTRLINGSNGDVTYKAGDLIILSNGFRATEGNTVKIGLKPCGINLN